MIPGVYYAIADDGFGRLVEITKSPLTDDAFWAEVEQARHKYPTVSVVQCISVKLTAKADK